ncbi:hypothetical protein TNCV_359711 [Trichonephila clavipes]|nr:hypothetical protein TNCV_359711 [Trichonephila clavipes]
MYFISPKTAIDLALWQLQHHRVHLIHRNFDPGDLKPISRLRFQVVKEHRLDAPFHCQTSSFLSLLSIFSFSLPPIYPISTCTENDSLFSSPTKESEETSEE